MHPNSTSSCKQEDLVSIIMPSYNSESFISESITSVINQSYKNWELLICDDNSSDNTIDIINHYLNRDSRIHLIRSYNNFGPAVSRNKCIDEARGRFIAFLDSDDLWTPDKLDKQINFMKERETALTYGKFTLIDEQGNTLKNNSKHKLPDHIDYKGLLKNPIIGCLTAVYDVQKCGKQKMPVIRKRQDFALWLRILKQGHQAYCIPETIGYYRIRKGSVSRNKWIAATYNWKLYRKVEKLPIWVSSWVFICYIYNKIMR